MKKYILTSLLALLLPLCALAHDFVVDGVCYNVISEEHKLCEVTYFKKESGELHQNFYNDVVFIPETVDFDGKRYFVSAIGQYAFHSQNELLSVVMPKTIKTIDIAAFYRCKKLNSLTIPAGVEKIEFGAFMSLVSLKYLAVDEGNKVYDSRQGCNAIIETETNTLLIGCKSTTIPDGVEVIASNAFEPLCSRGGKSVAFDIPGSVKVIKEYAFHSCDWLSAVTLRDGLEEIGKQAFWGTSIESIVIPKTVEKIDPYAFYNTNQLKSIKVDKKNKVYDSRNGCNAIIESATHRLQVACSGTIIPDGVRIIGESSFYRKQIANVAIPKSVVEIEDYAFCSCELKGCLVVPGNVKTIGKQAFSVSKIDELVLEEGVEAIGNSAFSQCRNLRRIKLPASLKMFGSGKGEVKMFAGCELLEEIDLSIDNPYYFSNGYCIVEKSTLTLIAGIGLGQCFLNEGMQEYSPKRIAKGAFTDLYFLKNVYLPGTIEEIEQDAFKECSSIEYLYCGAKIPPLLAENFKSIAKRHLPFHERVELVVPEGTLEAYRNAPGWKDFKHIRELVVTHSSDKFYIPVVQ